MGNPKNRARKRTRKHSTRSNNSTENVDMDAAAVGDDEEAVNDNEECCSAKKMKPREERLDINTDNYIMFINFQVLKDMFSIIGHCPECKQTNIKMENILSARMGFANKIVVTCDSCSWEKVWWTSHTCGEVNGDHENMKQGRTFYEVNTRTVVAFREMGQGEAGIKKFSWVMNMDGMDGKTVQNINKQLQHTYEAVCEESMLQATVEIKKKAKEETQGFAHCCVSLDASWQKRGHQSHNGLVTAISGGKCVDRVVYSKFCKGCDIWSRKKGTAEYDRWSAQHDCKCNHSKSSSAMESAGATEIFQQSVQKYGLIYSEYLGDGNTSSFNDVVKAKPYEEYSMDPKKLECWPRSKEAWHTSPCISQKTCWKQRS